MLSENSNVLCKDRLDRHPLLWAHCFGTPEMTEIIQVHCGKKTEVTAYKSIILDLLRRCEGALVQ